MNSINKIRLNFLVAVILLLKNGYAQLPDYHVQVLDESVGVYANVMRSLVIDKKDFLWMMYEDRVQRYDGRENKEFVLDNNKLLSICCDDKNQIWVNSNKHIFKFISDRQGFAEVAYDTVKGILFGQFVQLQNKPLCILTNNGFYQLDTSLNRFVALKESAVKNLSQKNFDTRWKCSSVYNNTIFFVYHDSLYAYNTVNKTLRSFVCQSRFSVNALNENEAIVSSWRDSCFLYDFQQNTIRLLSITGSANNKNTFFRIGGVQQIKPGYWLASSNQGLLEYNSTTKQFHVLRLYNKGSLLQKTISPGNIYLDGKQNIWVVCDFGLISFPVFKQQIGLIRNYTSYTNSLWGNDVRNFAGDNNGNLWVATYGSFYCWNVKSGMVQPYFPVQGAKNVLNFRSIRGIAYDGKYVILGQTDLGMWLFDPVHKTYCRPFYKNDSSGIKTKEQIESDFINQIYTLKNGDHLIIARDADYLLANKTYVLQQLNLPFNNKHLISRCAYQDNEARIWISTSNGLYCFDSDLHFLFEVSAKNNTNDFTSLCEWSSNKYLVGAGGGQGIYWLQTAGKNYTLKKITNAFDHKGGIAIVYKDSINRAWLGTQNGLYCFNPLSNAVETFDYTDNVQGASYNSNAALRYNKILFFGGQNGINYFIPEAMQPKKDSLKLSVIRVVVDNDDTSYNSFDKTFHLKYFQNSIRVNYVAPYYFNAGKIKYRYRLEGINKIWVDNNDNTSCYFTLVPPGSYVLHIAASINGINWFESNEKFSFIISPPYWQTWWFYLLCTVAVAFILYAVYRIRINKIIAIQNVRNSISRELHDDVGSTLSSLHIVSALAKKKLKDDPQKTEELLERITESSERMTGNMQDIVWAVNPLNDSFAQIIARMQKFAAQLCEAKNIELIFDADEHIKLLKLPLQYRTDLFMIFKEAVNNLAKYSNATKASIGLHKINNYFLLEIKDNGVGFDMNDAAQGNGLRNIQNRTKNLHGRLTIISNNEGTKITLMFSA